MIGGTVRSWLTLIKTAAMQAIESDGARRVGMLNAKTGDTAVNLLLPAQRFVFPLWDSLVLSM